MARLAVTGDVMLGRLVAEVLRHAPAEHPWGDLLPPLAEADLRMVNLECVIADSGAPAPKTFTFRAPPKAIDTLRAAHVDLVNLANNHVLDYGEEAFLEMLGRLTDAGIPWVGAGRNEAEAWKPAVLESQGLRMGVLGITDNEPRWAAGSDRPGIAHLAIEPRGERFRDWLDLVARTRDACDLLVIAAHWGPNMRREPTGAFRRFARRTLDAGADLWWGTSAHLFQGVERRDGKAILYDAGDLVDDYRVDPQERNDLSFLFLVEATRQGIGDIELVPTQVTPSACGVDQATGEDAEWAMRRMEGLCEAMGTRVERTERGLQLPAAR